jgi:glucose/arabinose dehydrogenase
LGSPIGTPIPGLPTQTGQPTTLPGATESTGEDAPVDTPDSSANLTETPTEVIVPQASIPDPNRYRWEEIARGFDLPLDLTHAGDSNGRIFIVEQVGLIHVMVDGQVLAKPYLDIRDRVGSEAFEQGLLGLAFHPEYARNVSFFVNYTDRSGNTVISRFHEFTDASIPTANSEARLLEIPQPFANHNGGGLAFGPDGYLYIGLGDGGSGGDPQGNGQSLNTLLGKLLRIDVDGGNPYAIPPDNPFANGGGRAEIWAYGLRNPWRFSFDNHTGDLYIADVGQNIWEEVNFVPDGLPGGLNFGWDYREAGHAFEGSPPANLTLIDPVVEYNHAGGHCSITGGFVYRGQALPAWQGVYIYADYCSGVVWGLVHTASGDWQSQQLFDLPVSISSFGVDQQGELYAVGQEGIIYRLVAVP